MELKTSLKDKTNATSASAAPSAEPNSRPQKIKLPESQGGKWRLTNKLRAEGILGPKETIRMYNAKLDFDSENEPSQRDNGAEGIEIESHGAEERGGLGGLLDRATNALKNDDLPKAKKVTPRAREDFSVLVVSVVTLLVTFAKVEERIKPNGDEINLFSEHLSGILLRHLPINNKLSADALDLIGIMAATATWYSRVHDQLAKSAPILETVPTRANGHAGGEIPITPIEAVSPETGNWLNRIAASGSGAG
jgi:hypothetical protein